MSFCTFCADECKHALNKITFYTHRTTSILNIAMQFCKNVFCFYGRVKI